MSPEWDRETRLASPIHLARLPKPSRRIATTVIRQPQPYGLIGLPPYPAPPFCEMGASQPPHVQPESTPPRNSYLLELKPLIRRPQKSHHRRPRHHQVTCG